VEQEFELKQTVVSAFGTPQILLHRVTLQAISFYCIEERHSIAPCGIGSSGDQEKAEAT
jgi:hypothetical protein